MVKSIHTVSSRIDPELSKQEKTRHKLLMFVISDVPFFLSHRLSLAVAAQRDGFDVVIAAPEKSDLHQLKSFGFTIQTFYLNRKSRNPLKELWCCFSIFRIFQRNRPDVVHLITAKPIFYGGLSARFLKIPTLAALTGMGYVYTHDTVRSRCLRVLTSAFYNVALNHPIAHVIFQNKDDRRIAEQAGFIQRASFSLIGGSGVDLSKIKPKPLPNGPIVVLLPARMLRDKGILEFIEAAQSIKAKGHNAIFRLLGDPDVNNPTSLSVEVLMHWNSEGVVEWKPYTTDIDSALSECHLVALPSYREGFPKTLIDAAAAGRAAVATDVPGCRDAIIDGVTGMLCAVRSPTSLANVLLDMISDRQRLIAMGNAARAHAERHFDIRQVEKAHLEIYASLTRRGE